MNKYQLSRPLTKALRIYIARSPIQRGKGFLSLLLRSLLPPEPASFVTTLPGGTRVALYYREVVGLVTLIYGGLEDAEVACLCAHAKPDTTAIDAGANIGIFTVALARAVGPHGRVLAFEPLTENVERLKANLAMNGLQNADIYMLAAGATDGEIPLHLGDDPAYHSIVEVRQNRGTGKVMTVPVARVDTIWQEDGARHISVLKVDVEGAELDVLIGGQQMLACCHPIVLIEAATDENRKRLTDWLSEQGYTRNQPAGFRPWNFLFVWNGKG